MYKTIVLTISNLLFIGNFLHANPQTQSEATIEMPMENYLSESYGKGVGHDEKLKVLMIQEAIENTAKKNSNVPNKKIDVYRLGWRGHIYYEFCAEEFSQVNETIRENVRLKGTISKEFLQTLAEQRDCQDIKSTKDQVVELLDVAVEELSKKIVLENASEAFKSNEADKVRSILEELYGDNADLPIQYIMIEARLEAILGNLEKSIKIILDALKLYPNDHRLESLVVKLTTNPEDYPFMEILLADINQIMPNLKSITLCPLNKRLSRYQTWAGAYTNLEKILNIGKQKSQDCSISDVHMPFVKCGLAIYLLSGGLSIEEAHFEYTRRPELNVNKVGDEFIETCYQFGRKLTSTILKVVLESHDLPIEEIRTNVKAALKALIPLPVGPSQEFLAEKRAEAIKKGYNQSESGLLPHLQIHEQGYKRDRSLAISKAEEFKDHVNKSEWWEASKAYEMADMNAQFFGTVQEMRDALNESLPDLPFKPNSKGINIALLGFGWRNEYLEQFLGISNRKELAIKKLLEENTPPLTIDQIKGSLKYEILQDTRPECERTKDVAEVFAEALLWDKALETLLESEKDSSCKVSNSDLARIIGAFSNGIQRGLTKDKVPIVKKGIEYVISRGKLLSSKNDSLSLQAAILSLYNNIKVGITKGSKSFDSKNYQEAVQLLGKRLKPKNPNPDQYLASVSPEELAEVLEKSESDEGFKFIHLIDRTFVLQRKNGHFAHYTRARVSHAYYKRYNDYWKAWIWLREMMRSRDSAGERTFRSLQGKFAQDTAIQVGQLEEKKLLNELILQLSKWALDQTNQDTTTATPVKDNGETLMMVESKRHYSTGRVNSGR